MRSDGDHCAAQTVSNPHQQPLVTWQSSSCALECLTASWRHDRHRPAQVTRGERCAAKTRPLPTNHRPGRILLLGSKVMARICYFPFLNINHGDKDPSPLSKNCSSSSGIDLLSAGRLVNRGGQNNQPATAIQNMFNDPVWDWYTMTTRIHVRTVPECVIINYICWFTYWKTCLCLQQPPVNKGEF